MYIDKLTLLAEEDKERIIELGYSPVTVNDKAIFDPYYGKMNEDWSSPMSFMAMIAWESVLSFYYKKSNDYLTLLGWDASDGRMTMLPLIGHYDESSVKDAFYEAREDHEKLGYSLNITDMREWMKPYYEGIPDTKWEKKESDSFYDYVYDSRYFDSFSGKSGQNLRFFLKNYDYTVDEVTPEDLDTLKDFIRANWCSVKDCSYCNYGCSINCLEQIVPVLSELNGFGIIVRIDGKIAGFCIGSRSGNQSILHFQTTAGNYKGLGVFMYSECKKRFLSGIDKISLGEDMGISGIRTYKQRLAPHEWIPRFEYDLKD
ncbi:phosphatidylglycerol lysyltransferase domain-containing protein [Butyrivibrio sp. WCE2006]|uniref:phosphatidylglycerol lysyltransferase domain-containing protein n=1 Tax=Butyrivibrio sp. WCE2006 TaxID=1410611 RepID=UPI0005D14881|nr:phosphatidylglycerol lysyltransferase domain-containing protein [Butyrivibrio sp. WCE2006]